VHTHVTSDGRAGNAIVKARTLAALLLGSVAKFLPPTFKEQAKQKGPFTLLRTQVKALSA
jgi:hypothetical protein